MAKPLPLPVWDRQAGKLITEWMDDHPTTYESEPQRSIRQWIKSQPLHDWPATGAPLRAMLILGNPQRAPPFMGGPGLLARLAPVDYHRAHYPDDGRTLDHDRLGRRLWTVNPHALRNKQDILFVNERNINILQTRNFGRLAFVEIGALSVGRIVQIHPLDSPFHRGEDKSVFRFGGSAIIMFGDEGSWRPSDDLLKHTRDGVETLVRLGDAIV